MSDEAALHEALGALKADMASGTRQRAVMFEQLQGIRSVQDQLAGCLPGLKKMLEDHEHRLRVVEVDKHTRAGRAAGAGAAGGGLVAILSLVAAWFAR